ncbi:MAG TPA: VOC family protein [Acidimicrobiia bacterium]|jgi:catechol 2,3-dioxygenase-like lactoylglutathione lyase family enzyme
MVLRAGILQPGRKKGSMGVGTLRCVVINVTDLHLAYRFWSEVTGLEVIGSESGWHDWLGYLGTRDPWKHEVILQRVDTSPLEVASPDPDRPNPVHIDITPSDGIDRAIERIVALGGRVKKAPSLYPRPGSHGDERPLIDWAVMQDPFGNEFCLVDDLTLAQSHAAAAASGATTDHDWRIAAGVTTAD